MRAERASRHCQPAKGVHRDIKVRPLAGQIWFAAAAATVLSTSTPTRTSTPTVPIGTTPSATPTATGPAEPCVGDCNNDRVVTIDELILGVRIALDAESIFACRRFDGDGDETVTIPELIEAVGNALAGCP